MDWLKDKKNQPIVALIASLVIVAVIVVMYFTVFKPSDDSASTGAVDTTATSDPNATADPNAGMPPAQNPMAPAGQPAAGQPTAPAGQPAASAGAQVASTEPTETWRADPFLPVGYKPPVRDKGPRPKPPIWDLPIPAPVYSGRYMFKPEDQKKIRVYESPQPARRMAGLMLNGKVYAIIETNGASEIVQPGDLLKDGLAMVEKIERDKVVLKTTDDKPRFLVVSMAAGRQSGYNGGSSGGGAPGGMPGGTPGGMPMPGPGGMPRPGGAAM